MKTIARRGPAPSAVVLVCVLNLLPVSAPGSQAPAADPRGPQEVYEKVLGELGETQRLIEQMQWFLLLAAGIALACLAAAVTAAMVYFFIRKRARSRYPVPPHYDREVEYLAEIVFGERPPALDLKARIDWFKNKRDRIHELKMALPAGKQDISLFELIQPIGVFYRPFQKLKQYWPLCGGDIDDIAAQMEKTFDLLHDHARADDATPDQTISVLLSRLRVLRDDLQTYRNPAAVMSRYHDHPLADAVPSFALLYDRVYKLNQSVRLRESRICALNAASQSHKRDLAVCHSAVEGLLKLTEQPNHNRIPVSSIKEIVNQQTSSQIVLQIMVRSGLDALQDGFKKCDGRISALLNRVLHLDIIIKYLDMLLATEPLAWTHENLKKQYIEERGFKRNHLHLLLRAEAFLSIYFTREEATSEIRNAICDICTAFRFFMRAEGVEFEHVLLLQQPAATDKICHEADPKLHESASIRESVKTVAKYRSNFVVDVKRFGWKKQGSIVRPAEVVLFSPSEWL